MENTGDEWNNVTTSSPEDVTFNQQLIVYHLAFEIIYTIIGIVGVIDNVFVIVVFIFFIKIADKVLVRICDYAMCQAQAFDVVDHSALLSKLSQLDLPPCT